MKSASRVLQQETAYRRDRISSGPSVGAEPPPCKKYPDSRRMALPPFAPSRPMTLDETLKARKSVRRFRTEPLGLGQLGYLLWAATGLARRERGDEFRTAPSAGARYPIETYVVANNVEGIDQGVYHYAICSHELEQLAVGDLRATVAAAALDQQMCALAPVVFVWTAIFARTEYRYRQRAYRYIYLDAGHIAENLALAAVGLSLGSCQVGAFYDDEANTLVGVNGADESVVYMSVVGVPAGTRLTTCTAGA
jgi:SagB-type dehydrogenase family enzyme